MLLSEDHLAVQDAVRAFVQAEVAPHAAAWDRGHTFPADALRGLAALGCYGVACVTNVPASVPTATVLAAMQAHAATYNATVTAMTAVPRCIGSGQSITVDWSRTSSDPWGTAVWGDEG